jgi:hypothetical protein
MNDNSTLPQARMLIPVGQEFDGPVGPETVSAASANPGQFHCTVEHDNVIYHVTLLNPV